MAGLARIAKMYGGMVINGVHWAWDYANDEAVKSDAMPAGSSRWKASEQAKALAIEARRAATLGAVHESAGRNGNAQGRD